MKNVLVYYMAVFVLLKNKQYYFYLYIVKVYNQAIYISIHILSPS